MQNQEFINQFIDEAVTHVEKIESALIKSDQLANDMELINEMFRAVHSIKGTAGFFGLKNIVYLSHAMENVLDEIRNGNLQITGDITDIMLKSNDALKDMIGDIYASEEYNVEDCVAQLQKILNGSEDCEEEVSSLKLITEDNVELTVGKNAEDIIDYGLRHGHHLYKIRLKNKDISTYDEGFEILERIKAVSAIAVVLINGKIILLEEALKHIEAGEENTYFDLIVTSVVDKEMLSKASELDINSIDMLSVKKGETVVIEEDIPVDNSQPKQELKNESFEKSKNKSNDSIRVNVQILNDLLNLASELVLGRNQLLRTLEDYKKSIPGLVTILQNVDHLTSSLQEKIMRTRMQPVGNVFNKFPRIIRDISKQVNKEIELVIEGSEVELDKSMIEALADPLTHLVRNAADHGLESADVRESLHKNRIGTIKLRAYHEGGFVNIDVTDNGAGIDVEKVRNKAVEKQLISRTEADKLSTQEALQLIFKPGFSTKDNISDISGRGVGMDVVKTNIENLGGSTEIYTSLGSGTTIRLIMPLTLAIIQSLIVETDGQRFALPQVNLQEIVRVKEGDNSRKIERINDAEVIRLRGKLVPIVHLSDIFTSKREKVRETKDVSIIIVLKIGAVRFGIAVDSIIGSEETLVKPLPKALKECIFYSGVTIMGDGKPAMILDADGIIKKASLDIKMQSIEENEAKENITVDTEVQDLLLFKCIGKEKFAIDMNMVARVEEVAVKDIQHAGDREFLNLRGSSLRIIRLNDYLPIQPDHNAEKKDKMYVIIPKLVTHPLGILADSIVDNVRTKVNLNTEDIKTKGILGTALLSDDLIVFLHLYELFEIADPEHYESILKKTNKDYKILFVEDTPFFQRVTMDYLLSAGFSVKLAHNGQEAWDLLHIEDFDLVLSDIHMPVMDGYELVSRIKDNATLKRLPVVALTSMTDEEHKHKGLKKGFDYYEYKLDRERLMYVIENALGGGDK